MERNGENVRKPFSFFLPSLPTTEDENDDLRSPPHPEDDVFHARVPQQRRDKKYVKKMKIKEETVDLRTSQ